VELNQTTAVITGSTGRLGAALAEALAQVGCNCICHYNTNRQKAQELAQRIQQGRTKALAVQANLTRPEQIQHLFEEAINLGVPQVMINSAAVFSRCTLSEVTFEEARTVFDLNLTAAILTSRVFAEKINEMFPAAESPVGKIINIADVGGIRPWAGYTLYCASKAGLIGATKALAKELAPAICVNSIAPGVVTWPDGFDESEKKRQLSFIPAARIGRLDELTAAAIFLLKNDYITGQVLNVDGGRCI